MSFMDELRAAAAAGAQGAVRDAAGAAVSSGETQFSKSTGIKIAQPLPPAGPDATKAGTRTSAAPSPSAAAAPVGGFQVNKTVLIIASIALVVLVLLRSRGARKRG